MNTPENDPVALRRRIEELEASAAGIREALEWFDPFGGKSPVRILDENHPCPACGIYSSKEGHAVMCWLKRALSTTAGADFLARHKAMEVERDAAIKCLTRELQRQSRHPSNLTLKNTSVVAIRCTKHFRVPPYNRNECMGGECPVCEVEKLHQEITQLKGFKVVLDHICDIVTEFPNTNENVTVAVERIKRERDQSRAELVEAKRLIDACLHTGSLLTESTCQLYLDVCKFLEVKP